MHLSMINYANLATGAKIVGHGARALIIGRAPACRYIVANKIITWKKNNETKKRKEMSYLPEKL